MKTRPNYVYYTQLHVYDVCNLIQYKDSELFDLLQISGNEFLFQNEDLSLVNIIQNLRRKTGRYSTEAAK